MENKHKTNLDEDTIRMAGLRPIGNSLNATLAPGARVFEYPGLEKVYIMESDLYGNVMPQDTVFLAYEGRNGLMGQKIKVETLRSCNTEDIKNIVNRNHEG